MRSFSRAHRNYPSQCCRQKGRMQTWCCRMYDAMNTAFLEHGHGTLRFRRGSVASPVAPYVREIVCRAPPRRVTARQAAESDEYERSRWATAASE
jgi:hypothetical protein